MGRLMWQLTFYSIKALFELQGSDLALGMLVKSETIAIHGGYDDRSNDKGRCSTDLSDRGVCV